jgi:hypothetical protein
MALLPLDSRCKCPHCAVAEHAYNSLTTIIITWTAGKEIQTRETMIFSDSLKMNFASQSLYVTIGLYLEEVKKITGEST